MLLRAINLWIGFLGVRFHPQKKVLSIRCAYLRFLHPLEARRWGCAYTT